MIKILIADDHAIVREGLKQIVADTSDMAVAGEAVGETSSQKPSANPPSSGGGNLDTLSLWALLIIGLLARAHFHCACAVPRARLLKQCRKSCALHGHHPGAYVTIRSCIQL